MIVGLTGGIGSGKSDVTRLLEARWSVPVIDADQVARDVVAPGTKAADAIAARYPEAACSDGTLDRQWLRRHVLPDDDERAWLESVTHPAVRERIVQWLDSKEPGHNYVVLESPLLIESGQTALCDRVVVVDARENQQLQRAGGRDNQTTEQIRSIMNKQSGREHRLQTADIVVDNTGARSLLTAQVDTLHHRLLEIARGRQPH